MVPSRQELHSVQHGFTVKPTTDPWTLPKLPPLHQHGLSDRSHAPGDGVLTRLEFGNQHPTTPQQLHVQRPLAASRKHSHQHRSHGNFSHEDSDALDEDTFGIKKLVSICASGSFSPKTPAGHRPEPHLEVVGTTHASHDVRRLVRAVARGLRCCQEPQAAEAGLGGTYFFRSEAGAMVAIIKPCDEEPLAPNNPKGFVGRQLGEAGLKPTVRVGEAALREVAAFLLDHDNFAKVPPTVLVRCFHPIFHTNPLKNGRTPSPSQLKPQLLGSSDDGSDEQQQQLGKLGSLQEFVAHDGDTSDVGASRFAASDVRRIGILDIRLFNTDRHAGNMLVVPPQRNPGARGSGSGGGGALARLAEARCSLRPIDHGFCLPEALEPPYLEWLHWPQAMMPFSSEELAYIAALDADADCELLSRELPALRPECGRTLQVSTMLLQRAAAAGLSLAEIGHVVSRPLVGMDEEKSALENLCIAARASVDSATTAADNIDGSMSDDSFSTDSDSSTGFDADNELHLSDSSDEDDAAAASWPEVAFHVGRPYARRGSFTGPCNTSLTAGDTPALDGTLGTVGSHMLPLGRSSPVAMPQGSGIGSGVQAAPAVQKGFQPASMLSDILSDDDESQLPPLPPEWEQQAVGSQEPTNPRASARGGLSAAFSSTALDAVQLSLAQISCNDSGTKMAADIVERTSPSDACKQGGAPLSPHTPGVALPDGRATLGFGHALPSQDSTSSLSASLPPSPTRGWGCVASRDAQLAPLPKLHPVRTSFSGDYCPSGIGPQGGSSGDLGMHSFGGRALASSSSDSPSLHRVYTAGASTFGGHTFGGRALRWGPHRPGSAADAIRPRGSAWAAAPETMLRGTSHIDSAIGGVGRRGIVGDATPVRRHRNGHKHKQHHAYPPPVEGRKPEAVNALFSGLSPQQWSAFMEHLREGIESALQRGIWRSERRREPLGVPIGASCPRF